MTIELLHPSPLDIMFGYIVYLFLYLFIVSHWYSRAKRVGIVAEEIPLPILIFMFVMGGPAIWLAYPLAKRKEVRE